jgi:hypothetical protein
VSWAEREDADARRSVFGKLEFRALEIFPNRALEATRLGRDLLRGTKYEEEQ